MVKRSEQDGRPSPSARPESSTRSELALGSARLTSVMGIAADLVVVLDKCGIVTEVGMSLADLLGCDPSDWTGRPLVDLVEADDRDAVQHAITTAATLGSTDVGHALFRVHHRDGSVVWIQARIANRLDDDAVAGLVMVMWDETERSTVIQGLRESEARFRSLAASSPLGILYLDADGVIIYANPRLHDILGVASNDAIRPGLVHPDDRTQVFDQMDIALTEVGLGCCEYRIVRPDGELRHVRVSTAWLGADGASDGGASGLVASYEDVTGEARSRANAKRMVALFEATPDVAFINDRVGRVLFANARATELLGITEGSDLDIASFPAVDEESRDLLRREMLPGTRRDGLWTGELTVATPDEGPISVSVVTIAHRDEAGEIDFVSTMARDITHLKEVESKLAASESWFRSLVSHALDIVSVSEADGRLVFISPAIKEVLGYDADALIRGDIPVPEVHPDDLEAVRGAGVEVQSTRSGTTRRVYRVRHRDGQWRWIESRFTNMLDDPSVRGIVVNSQDITARRWAEAARRETEEKFRALVQHGSDVLTVLNADGTIRYANPAAVRVFGFDEQELGRDPLMRVHPDDAAGIQAIFERILETPGVTGPGRVRARHADGSYRVIEAVANNLIADPEINGVIVTARDVTDQDRAEMLVTAQAAVLERVARGRALPETLEAVCRLVEDCVDGAVVSVMLTEPGRHRLILSAGPNLPSALRDALRAGVGIRDGGGACASAAARAAEVVVDDVGNDPSVAPFRGVLAEAGLHACWAIPILASVDRRVLGTLSVYWARARQPTEEDRRVLDALANLAAIAIEHKASEEQLEYQALHDPLTGLPNRMLFLGFLSGALARAGRSRTGTAVLFLDLDAFKVFNDSMGHEFGDELLVAVAQRLRETLRPGDTVARFGGDEFTILCDELNAPDARRHAIDVAERVLEALAAPFVIDETERFLSASIGIALATGGGDHPEHLLRDADAAMYRAKDQGKDRWEFFDERMRARVHQRLETESAMHRALERGEFAIFYQPIVSLDAMRFVGVEALLRWQHPDRGLIEPDQFVPLAEETGLIVPLGAWVLDEVARQHRRWSENPDIDASLVMSVNLSARQIGSTEIVETVARALDGPDMSAESLCLEITESVLLDDTGAAEKTLTELKNLGVTLSMDDFGTGYSSLSYLKRFPIDSVKIDRSFINGLGRDPEDSAIVAGVVSLGRALGLTVVAEGVETDDQLVALGELGCDCAQGFLFSPPRPDDEIEPLLAEGVPREDGSAGLSPSSPNGLASSGWAVPT